MTEKKLSSVGQIQKVSFHCDPDDPCEATLKMIRDKGLVICEYKCVDGIVFLIECPTDE